MSAKIGLVEHSIERGRASCAATEPAEQQNDAANNALIAVIISVRPLTKLRKLAPDPTRENMQFMPRQAVQPRTSGRNIPRSIVP